ncbi:hypothetical protein MMC13_004007 [Lambiella insularis]|nr:hypothetical protein [Lambiella insularis]
MSSMEPHIADTSKDFAPKPNLEGGRWSLSDSGSTHSGDSSSPPTTIGSEKSGGKTAVRKAHLSLPENGSTAPVLWTIDHGSKWSAHFRAVNLRMHGILWDANYFRPQFGLFSAGDDPNDPKKSTQVFAILLDPRDIKNWTKVNEHVLRLFQMYWGSVGIPPVRYWSKQTKPKASDGEKVEEVVEETQAVAKDASESDRARPLTRKPSINRATEPKRFGKAALNVPEKSQESIDGNCKGGL